jgi:uridine kinase
MALKPKRQTRSRYGLEAGIRELENRISRLSERKGGPVIVNIAGGSASGKTLVSSRMKRRFGKRLAILSMDDYYRGVTYNKKHGVPNFDVPEAQDIALFAKHLKVLKAGKSIEKPIYDFVSGDPTGTETFSPKKVIIVEGLFPLYDGPRKVSDISVFVETSLHGRMLRRLFRDPVRTQRGFQHALRLLIVATKMHDKHVGPQIKKADIVITNEYNPGKEAERSAGKELQVTFRKSLDRQKLELMGGVRIGSVEQEDRYYNPMGIDLRKGGEILRIRRESDDLIFTYKGPNSGSGGLAKRPRLDFRLEPTMAKDLGDIYGKEYAMIIKRRDLYLFNGIVVSCDTILSSSAGKGKKNREFIELRAEGDKTGESALKESILKLGLKKGETVKGSYLDSI